MFACLLQLINAYPLVFWKSPPSFCNKKQIQTLYCVSLCMCVRACTLVRVHSQVWLNKAGVFQLLGPQKASFPPSSLLPDPLSLTQMHTHTHTHTFQPQSSGQETQSLREGGGVSGSGGMNAHSLHNFPSKASAEEHTQLYTLSLLQHTPTDGEHPSTPSVLFLCAWEDSRHTCCRAGLGENFLTQLAYVAFKEELMVHKGDGKEGEKNCSTGKKASSLLWHCLSSKWSHSRRGSTVDNTGLDLIRELLTRSSSPLLQLSFRLLFLTNFFHFFFFPLCFLLI